MGLTERGSPMRNVDPQEWEVRCDLAAAYRLIAHYGMDDLIYTHLSARLPGRDHRFLLNPYGLMFDEITASSLVAVDPDGQAVEKEDESKINNAGFTIHSAVHMSRDDAHCVMHTHTTASMAVAAQDQGLLPLNQMSMAFFGGVAYHDYEGIALDLDERERLVRSRRQGRDGAAQSRPADGRPHRRRGVPQHLLHGAVLPPADRCDLGRPEGDGALGQRLRPHRGAVQSQPRDQGPAPVEGAAPQARPHQPGVRDLRRTPRHGFPRLYTV